MPIVRMRLEGSDHVQEVAAILLPREVAEDLRRGLRQWAEAEVAEDIVRRRGAWEQLELERVSVEYLVEQLDAALAP